MRSSVLVATLALAAILLPLPALAAGSVASVDLQRLIREAPQAKASRKLLQDEYAPRAKAIEQERERVVSLLKHYRALGPGTNQLKRASALEQVKQARKKLDQLTHQYDSGLGMRKTQLRANFKRLVDEQIQAYATAHGFSLVIGDSVAYAGPATDITDEILALLEKSYRKAQASADGGGG